MHQNLPTREAIIENYLAGYNTFNVEQMVWDMDEQIVFENRQNGKITLTLWGLPAFKQQAEQAKVYFTERTQTLKSVNHAGDTTITEIDYRAILQMDLPNGLQKGQELKLTGKSIFQFANDRIIRLTDIS